MNLILFGPPGAGKGTQSQFLVQNFNYMQVSTGDLLRDEIKKNSDLGKKINKKIENGEFVDDEIVNILIEKIVKDKKNKNKIIFDGYPRNLQQAKNLDKILLDNNQSLHAVIYMDVSKDIIKKRILGRIVCEKCNLILNEYIDIKEIQNHKCGKKYFKKRKDDNLQTIMKRYDTFVKETNPLIEFYVNKPNFFKVDATLKIQEITSKIAGIINV